MIGQNVGQTYTHKKKHNKTRVLLQTTRGKDETNIVSSHLSKMDAIGNSKIYGHQINKGVINIC
jgi:hypothetical protein